MATDHLKLLEVPAVPSGAAAVGLVSTVFVRDLGELLAVRRRLVLCASSYGFRLRTVFVESVGRSDVAFDAFTSLLESEDSPLVVPTLHYLTHLGDPLAIRDHLNRSGHPVLVATEPAERTC